LQGLEATRQKTGGVEKKRGQESGEIRARLPTKREEEVESFLKANGFEGKSNARVSCAT
jgi:hypothetical protein